MTQQVDSGKHRRRDYFASGLTLEATRRYVRARVRPRLERSAQYQTAALCCLLVRRTTRPGSPWSSALDARRSTTGTQFVNLANRIQSRRNVDEPGALDAPLIPAITGRQTLDRCEQTSSRNCYRTRRCFPLCHRHSPRSISGSSGAQSTASSLSADVSWMVWPLRSALATPAASSVEAALITAKRRDSAGHTQASSDRPPAGLAQGLQRRAGAHK